MGEGVEVKVGSMAASPLSEVGEEDLTGVELDVAVAAAACIGEGSPGPGGEGADMATGVPPPLEEEGLSWVGVELFGGGGVVVCCCCCCC